MSGRSLRAAEWVAFAAALALLLATSVDWYSTARGEEARRIQELTEAAEGIQAGQSQRELAADAATIAEGAEENAWQADSLVDRLILGGLLLTAGLVALGTLLRAAGRAAGDLGPAGLAGGAAACTALLVLYRMAQEPGLDAATTLQLGPPLALALLGVVALATALGARTEEAAREPSPGEAAQPRPAT